MISNTDVTLQFTRIWNLMKHAFPGVALVQKGTVKNNACILRL